MTKGGWALAGAVAADDGGEDERQLLGLLPEGAGVFAQLGLGCNDHADLVLGLARLALADTDAVAEFLAGVGLVRLAVVGADAGGRADELPDQRRRHKVDRYAFRERDD